jgi:toxin ParE1/3/4
MAEYRLTPAAEADLEAIWRATVRQWGRPQAGRYLDLLTEACAVLARSPTIAPSCDHIQPGYRRWPVERHVIDVRVAEYGIAVIRVLHDRMDAAHRL